MLLVGISLAALVEVVLVCGIGEESVVLAGAESRASAAAAATRFGAGGRVDWDHRLRASGAAYLERPE